jgi:NSS family neurotransmitter:Na+ symporter
VGLENIWKFPYITGVYGGGAFVLVYLLCIASIGIPIMMAEVMIGRRGQQSLIRSMAILAKQEGRPSAWQAVGWSGVLGAFSGATAETVRSLFSDLLSDPVKLLVWHTVFMGMTVFVVARGVKAGLEKAVTILMPALFVMLLVMVGYAMTTGGFAQGAAFLFQLDFSKLPAEAILTAMGHAFFSLGVGMGVMIAYGSYLPKDVSITQGAVIISIMDTVVALLAGLAIFPIVFANNLEPGQGPGLVFQTLPLAFGQMPGGLFFGTLFFILLVFAAWTSSIGQLEPVVEWLEEHHGVKRRAAALGAGFVIWLLGIASVLSFNLWSEITLLGRTVFDTLDFLTGSIMLPLTGLLVALFAGWAMSKAPTQEELGLRGTSYRIWYFLIRYVSPIGVAVVFVYQLT